MFDPIHSMFDPIDYHTRAPNLAYVAHSGWMKCWKKMAVGPIPVTLCRPSQKHWENVVAHNNESITSTFLQELNKAQAHSL